MLRGRDGSSDAAGNKAGSSDAAGNKAGSDKATVLPADESPERRALPSLRDSFPYGPAFTDSRHFAGIRLAPASTPSQHRLAHMSDQGRSEHKVTPPSGPWPRPHLCFHASPSTLFPRVHCAATPVDRSKSAQARTHPWARRRRRALLRPNEGARKGTARPRGERLPGGRTPRAGRDAMDAGSRLGGRQGVVAEKGGQTQSSDERAHGCGRAGPLPAATAAVACGDGYALALRPSTAIPGRITEPAPSTSARGDEP